MDWRPFVGCGKMARYDPDGAKTVVASWSSAGVAFPVGTHSKLGGRDVSTLVFQTGRAARIDDYADASGPVAELVREFGFRAAVGVPVRVEGRLWGAMLVDSSAEALPMPRLRQLQSLRKQWIIQYEESPSASAGRADAGPCRLMRNTAGRPPG